MDWSNDTLTYSPAVWDQVQVLLAFLAYQFFFAWFGSKLGTRKSLWLFLISLGAYIALTQFPGVFINLANLFGKFVNYVFSGGLGSGEDAFDALKAAPSAINYANAEAFLFLVWLVIVFMTFFFVIRFLQPGSYGNLGWAVLFGIANGLLLAYVVLPRLAGIFLPPGVSFDVLVRQGSIARAVTNSFRLIWQSVLAFWELIEPVAPVFILVSLTLVLILAARSLQRPSKKSDSSA
jgi:hypothetical protein